MKDNKVWIILLVLGIVLLCCCSSIVIGIFAYNYVKTDVNTDGLELIFEGEEILNTDTDNTNTLNESKYFTCLNNKNAKIEKIENYVFTIKVTAQESTQWGVDRTDNGVRKLNLDNVLNDKATNKIYMTMSRADGSTIEHLTYKMQYCDKNNQTTISGQIEDKFVNNISSDPGNGKSYSSTQRLYGMDFTDVRGVGRVDGYVYYNGQWRLVSRLDNLELF